MLKSCQYCQRVHDSKYDCGKKPKPKQYKTVNNKFRWSRRWREKRNMIVERDLGLCQICKANEKYTYNDLEVHHIIPLAEDYDKRLDDDNLITLCDYHHEEAERGKIKRDYLQELIK